MFFVTILLKFFEVTIIGMYNFSNNIHIHHQVKCNTDNRLTQNKKGTGVWYANETSID